MKALLYSLLFCFPLYSKAQTYVAYKGNTFTFSNSDQAHVYNPVTGHAEPGSIPAHPIAMNDAPVYDLRKITDGPVVPQDNGKAIKLSEYLVIKLQPELAQLEDGLYILQINYAVIDTQGRLAYYKFNGLKQQLSSPVKINNTKADIDGHTLTEVSFTFTNNNIDQVLCRRINEQAKQLLEHPPAMIPAQMSGARVNVTGDLFYTLSIIKVRQHMVSYEPCYFCL